MKLLAVTSTVPRNDPLCFMPLTIIISPYEFEVIIASIRTPRTGYEACDQRGDNTENRTICRLNRVYSPSSMTQGLTARF